jgi:cyclohexanone monooxygenase
MATGCLSMPLVPDIPGLEDFAGDRYQTSLWPHEGVDFSGRRVGVIGTGSSSIQAIPVIASQARHLTVFQRTPNFSVPAQNAPLDPNFVEQFKTHYREHRHYQKSGLSSGFGDIDILPKELQPAVDSALSISDEELARICDAYWDKGGAHFMVAIGDAMLNEESNRRVANYVRNKIRQIVKDPATAEVLCPESHPIGTKRICVDTGYFETYNRDNVDLVDLTRTPIERVTATGVQTTADMVELDALVLSTGFDAMTGALERIDIRGEEDVSLEEKWQAGPRSYLGLMMAGFPNLFLITGPGSPSVLSNMIVSIEQHVDFVVDCLQYMRDRQHRSVRVSRNAEDDWVAHVNFVANSTLYPKGGSWYLGANVPGKPRVFMPYAGGVGEYRKICEGIVADDYRGFEFG